MALSRDIVIRLLGDAKSAVDAQKAAADAAEVTVQQYRKAEREYDRQQKALETASRKQRQAMESVGRASAVAGAAIVAGLGLAIKAAVDWESAWTGVLKTVEGSPQQLADLEQGLRGLARTLPATHAEIAGVAEAAGQLGVATGDIVDFTRTMVNLGETTNLSADEAATAIAQMMNVMQTAPEDVDRLGSTLVALGNAGASTERQIIEMAQRISGAAAVVGLTEDEVLAFANAVASMGIEVESGGTSVSRVLTDMSKAAQTGGAELEVFAETAGMSAEDFARAFREDPAEAFAAFVEGLEGIQEAGGNVFGVLDDLGLSDVRVSQALLSMASSGDLLRESLNLGSQAWEENTALVEEAAKRYDTTAAKTELARNAINDAAIEIGDVFLPVMASLAEAVADVAGWFADLPDPIKNVLGGLSSIAGVGALAGGAFLLLAPRVMETYKAFQLLRASSPGAAAGLGKLAKAAEVAGGVALLGSAVHALDEAMAPAPATMEEWVSALIEMDGSVDSLNARFNELDEGLGGWTEIDNFGDAIRRITDPTNTERLNDFGGSLFNVLSLGTSGTGEGAASRRRSLEAIEGLDSALSLMVQNGNAELAAEQFQAMTEAAEEQGVSVDQLKELFPQYADALTAIDNEQKAAAESASTQAAQARALAQDTDVAYGSLQGYAAALGLSEEATADLIDKSNELGESLGGFVDPLGTYTGLLQAKAQAEADSANAVAVETGAQLTSWEDYVDGVHVAFDEYLAALQQQVADQAAWQENMLILAGRVSQGTLDELARMGPEGAPLVADLVNRSDAELADLDDVFAARSQDATNAWGQQLTLAQPVLAQIARTAGQDVVESLAQQLANGTTTVAAIARQYGIELAGGINPVLSALGRPSVHLSGLNGFNTGGGYYTGGFTGPGGKYEYAGPAHKGEVIWSQEDVAAHGGPQRVDALRRARGYASGGYVTAADVPRPYSTAPYGVPISTAGDAAMDSAYQATTKWLTESGPFGQALAWARSQVGRPYIWGGVGPVGYDCSGFMSAITNVMLGLSPYSRRGATANFPWPGFLPGDGVFTIGSTPDAGDGVGHMAGTLAGVNVESRGGQGVVVGGTARGAHDGLFGTRAHLASYRSGTPFVPDDGLAYLHRGERIVPAEFNRPVGAINVAAPQVTVYAQFGDETIEARAVRVVDAEIESALVAFSDRGRFNPWQ